MFRTFSKSFLFAAVLSIAIVGSVSAQKLTAEDIVAKNLDSIGSKEKRDGIKNRFVPAAVTFERKLPNIKGGGKAVIVSDVNNMMFQAKFNSNEYPYEKIGYFAGKLSLPYVTAGTRSPLGAYLNDHSKILEDGLFMGTISSAWALNAPKGRVTGGSKKKVDGRETYVLEYFPKNVGSEFTVKLFFDASTFQHVRTEYRRAISQQQQNFGTMGTKGGAFYTLTETFGDYRDAGGLMLPHSYKAHWVSNTDAGTGEYTWTANIGEYHFNQNLAADFFSFDDR